MMLLGVGYQIGQAVMMTTSVVVWFLSARQSLNQQRRDVLRRLTTIIKYILKPRLGKSKAVPVITGRYIRIIPDVKEGERWIITKCCQKVFGKQLTVEQALQSHKSLTVIISLNSP